METISTLIKIISLVQIGLEYMSKFAFVFVCLDRSPLDLPLFSLRAA